MFYKTILIVVGLLIVKFSTAQCTIYCKDVDKKNKTTMIGFKLFLEPQHGMQPVLISNNNGSLYLNRSDFLKLRNRRVVGFQFLNPLDHERYSMPVELKQRSFRLAELCGKSLIVGYLW